MSKSVPFLARFSERPAFCDDLPPLYVGSDGLLRRTEAESPFIFELLEGAIGGQGILGTIVTEATADQIDPDTVRSDRFHFDGPAAPLATFFTRAPEDRDPDAIRNAYPGMATSFTNGHVDQPDPDIIRR